ncbi:MAG: ATP-dependent RecD-like DNA helicase [Desulfobacteraceae bacterium]|nr:ATP-dependent RecD-like DNA helicase [Desulfobacteraceae bacterium]
MPVNTTNSTLEGRIERITYYSEDTHFTIARFSTAGQSAQVTLLGCLPNVAVGESLRVKGTWQEHPRYGQQFRVKHYEVLLPSDVEQIRHYLSSGMIKGIGPTTAERLVNHFGEQVLEVIEKEPQRLTEVQGIGRQTAEQIQEAWQDQHAVRMLMQFLQDCGVKPDYVARIYKTYGNQALKILKEDPYRAAADLPRVGFFIADAIVRHLKLCVDESQRAGACVLHLLESALEEGHMYIGLEDLRQECDFRFELDYYAIETALVNLANDRQIYIDREAPRSAVYLYTLYKAETGIATRVQAMNCVGVQAATIGTDELMEAVLRRLAVMLSEDQRSAVQSSLQQRVVIITGGPGTGKTTLIRAMSAVFDAVGKEHILAAPTGRAARRVSEITGKQAVTLHRLLGLNISDGSFERNQDNPLETGAVIVDEASMVDTVLMGHLLNAMPLNARLILVGDVSQLPSVGPGTVLADLIDSGRFAVFELRQVFRQVAQSPIIVRAHQVRKGELVELMAWTTDDRMSEFTFIECNCPDDIGPWIVELCSKILPEMGFDGLQDVQTLTPMHKGVAGTLHLNRLLQDKLNPGRGGGFSVAGNEFRLGDKVMHLRNNYQKEVFNGEIGAICKMDKDHRCLTVNYDGREVIYDEGDLDELTLAYAISVHKSQGSEYPVVILPLAAQHYIMLQRNLLYTALTRAQKFVVLVGSAKAYRVAVTTDKPGHRRSLLSWRLAG